MRARNLAPAAALALLIAGTGFGQTWTSAPQPPPSGAAKKAGPTAPRKSDAAIERAIRGKLAKSKINPDHFNVHVQGGVATFEGNTSVIQHKGVATRLAKSAGAIRVANNIQIRQTARDKANANFIQGLKRAEIEHSDARSDAGSRPAVASGARGAQIGQVAPGKANANLAQGLKRAQIKRPDANSTSQPAVSANVSSAAQSR